MADRHSTGASSAFNPSSNSVAPLEVRVYPWGEIRVGTADQLRAAGFAPDRAYPGEPGGRARRLSFVDPFGLRCTVRHWQDARYIARSEYADEPGGKPGRPASHLPQFIRDRNARAVAAGVTIARQQIAADWCSHAYEGSAEQLVAMGFEPVSKLPSPRRKSALTSEARILSPLSVCGQVWCRPRDIGDGRLRVVLSKEPLGMVEEVAPGVSRHDGTDAEGRLVVFWGAPAAVRASGLVPTEALDAGRIYVNGEPEGLESVVWEVGVEFQGHIVVRHRPEAAARFHAAREQAARARRLMPGGIEEYRGYLDACCRTVAAWVPRPAESADGCIYDLAPDSRDEIEILAQQLRNAIETAIIVVHDLRPKAPTAAVTAARGDRALQAMLAAVKAN